MANKSEIEQAARIVREGGLVVFPTETVYGLGANALDASAVRKIYALKGRPATSPLIVHVASIEQAKELAAEWLPEAERLARQYWPGPLPIAAPSANRFTQLSPTTAEHVREAFGAETPFLLDGGPCEVGLESTVIAVTSERLEVLRPGMAEVGNAIAAAAGEGEAHRSPGQQRKHYSPKTRIVLVNRGHLPREGKGAYLWRDYNAVAAGKQRMPEKPEDYAAELYSALHKFDRQEFDWIAVELPPDVPEWAAIRDRLMRAAH